MCIRRSRKKVKIDSKTIKNIQHRTVDMMMNGLGNHESLFREFVYGKYASVYYADELNNYLNNVKKEVLKTVLKIKL